MTFLKQLGMNIKTSTKFTHVLTRYKAINLFTTCSQLYRTSPLKFVFPYHHLHKKYCFQSFKGDESDSDGEDIEYRRDIKNIILPNNDDMLTTEISECKSLQEIFELLKYKNNQLNWKNISMAIAMIREHQITYYRICLLEKNLNCSNLPAENSFKNVLINADFLNLLNLLEKHYECMDIQCLSYSLLCLHKIGVDVNCIIYQKLLQRLSKILTTAPVEDIESCVLSRFTISVASQRDLSSLFILKDILPVILKRINLCDTYEDIKHISMCLYNLPWFLNKCTMDNFVDKIENTLLGEPQDGDKIKCTIKVLRLLNSPFWSQNITLIRSLLLDLQGCVQNLSLYDMIQLQMIILKQFEPYQLFEEINNVTYRWLSKAEVDTDITILRLLSCLIPSSSAPQRKLIEKLLRKQFLQNDSFPKLCIGPLFNIIRNLKTSDKNICNAYWSSVMDWLSNGKFFQEHHKLLRVCNRYMNFNNNMAGTYRHFEFENQMIQWLNEELHQGVSALIPYKFSKIFSFFISYPNDNIGYDIPEVMVKKVINNIGQYSVYDCYIISRGLNNAFLNRKKKTSLPMFFDQYVRLCTALNKRSIEILNQEPELNINQLNSMYRGYNHRINVNDPELFYKILDRYKYVLPANLSSRTIRELTYNFIKSDWYDIELLDKCLEYYIKNHKYLLADSVEKMLTLFFLDGINSEKLVDFLPYATEIINRDKCKMSGLNFMRASLALCYFYNFSSSISDYLFSVEFLERLDNELNNCYGKATYPLKIRQLLMVLNRTVCIDYPEFDVPWFHTKYCEEFQSMVPKHTGSFYLEVEKKLNNLIKNKGSLKINTFSPYGYKLDFEVTLNDSRRHINSAIQNEKIVFLLLNEKHLRKIDNKMRGLSKMKQRHLEILGYRVIWIKKSFWNSMFMTEPEAKLSYLKSLLWPKP